MSASRVWAGLGVSTATALLLLLLLAPPQPSGRLSAPAALAAGLVIGAVLAVAVRFRVQPRARHLSPIQLGFLALMAVNEELIWRRALLGELLRAGPVVALVGSTVAFAFAHRARAGLHLFTGIAFGGIYLAAGTLAAPIAAHWAYNAGLGFGPRPRRAAS